MLLVLHKKFGSHRPVIRVISESIRVNPWVGKTEAATEFLSDGMNPAISLENPFVNE